MKTIPTAKEVFDIMLSKNDEATSTEMMIEFARLHVTEALKEASEKAITKQVSFSPNYSDEILYVYKIDGDSILNAYPLENIK